MQKQFDGSKSKLVVAMGFALPLIVGTTPAVFSGDTSAGTLLPSQIFEKVQEKYASLSSYSDAGQITSAMNDTATTTGFTTRLARPSFYRIEWDQDSESSGGTKDSGVQAAWSSGAGDYVEMGWGVQRESDREVALADAAATSDGAAATIPKMFFDLDWKEQPDDSVSGEKRLADEKIGKTDCYVISREPAAGETQTFWIGKQNFLIYRVRTEVSAKALQTSWAGAAKMDPEAIANIYGYSTIETHTNMVVNKQFSREDFVPSFPLFEQSN
jgi:outer membrane lipoprotein-sorting protein